MVNGWCYSLTWRFQSLAEKRYHYSKGLIIVEGNEFYTNFMLLEDFKNQHEFVSLYPRRAHTSHRTACGTYVPSFVSYFIWLEKERLKHFCYDSNRTAHISFQQWHRSYFNSLTKPHRWHTSAGPVKRVI